MSLTYNIDIGYGIRVKTHDAEDNRPSGYVVEIHFYDKDKAVEYAAQLISAASDEEPYVFVEKPVAKSSTSVMQAMVCQKCGHKFDGKIGGNGDPCKCKCHEGRV